MNTNENIIWTWIQIRIKCNSVLLMVDISIWHFKICNIKHDSWWAYTHDIYLIWCDVIDMSNTNIWYGLYEAIVSVVLWYIIYYIRKKKLTMMKILWYKCMINSTLQIVWLNSIYKLKTNHFHLWKSFYDSQLLFLEPNVIFKSISLLGFLNLFIFTYIS